MGRFVVAGLTVLFFAFLLFLTVLVVARSGFTVIVAVAVLILLLLGLGAIGSLTERQR